MSAEEDPLFKFLALVTTVLCFILKIPQIRSVLRSKSIDGISKASLMLEMWSYLTTVSYSMYFKYPFGLYSEYPSLIGQDVILLALIVLYDFSGATNKRIITFVPLSFVIHSTIAAQLVPKWVPIALLSISAPIGVLSKVVQLAAIIRAGDSGQVSAFGWFLNFNSNLARLATLLLSVQDQTLIVTQAVCSVLNLMVSLACVYYRQPEKLKRT